MLLILFYCRSTTEIPPRYFIIWNVGQGSWSTLVERDYCLHFDLGGTIFKFAAILKARCGQKRNFLFLTHFDADHINLIRKSRYSVPNLCLATTPAELKSHSKKRLLNSLPTCRNVLTPAVQILYRANFKFQNDSNVYLVDKKILVTGDLPSKKEKLLQPPKTVRYLLTGHHGSRTSSSSALLKKLTKISDAIASADHRKYGHPHKETTDRLKKAKIPLLTTESYGNIFIEL